MEKRANDAEEFFKSESESETELHDNENLLETSAASPPTVEPSLEHHEILQDESMPNFNANEKSTTLEPMEIIENNEKYNEGEMNSLQNVTIDKAQSCIVGQIEEIKERVRRDLPIITEIIELPRWNVNNMEILVTSVSTPSVSTPSVSTPSVSTPSISTPSPGFLKSQQRAQSIKHLLESNKITDSPTLKGGPDKLIDLDTGDVFTKPTPGINKLLERLMSSRKARKPKIADTISLLSTENGKVELNTVQLNHNTENDEMDVVEQKPGAAFLKLKENLKSIIKKKRLEEINKKQQQLQQQEQEEYEEDEEDDNDDDDDEEEENMKCLKNEDEKLNDIEIDEDENISVVKITYNEDDQEDEVRFEENCHKSENKDENDDEEEENEDENDDEEEENEDENDDEEEENDDKNENEDEKTVDNASKKRKTRFLKVFLNDSDDNDDDNEIDLLKTQSQAHKVTEEQLNSSIDMMTNEQIALPAFISQIPITQAANGIEGNEDELMALCSGTFDTENNNNNNSQFNDNINIDQDNNKNSQMKSDHNKLLLLSTDEEDDEIEMENDMKNRKKKLKKTRERQKCLQLSGTDDEYDDENTHNLNDIDDKNNNEEEEEETFVDYDSEENEIVVQMNKQERRMRAENFVENEAELSESEWGSADEDEKNLDQYDIELGDEDHFDRDAIHHELEQIHARKMLDEDLREVRKLQELLLEDEEKDGVGRERRFKWKNAEGGFSLDDSKRDNMEDVVGSDDDEINEHNWRKIRFEREQLLQEQRIKSSPNVEDIHSKNVQNIKILDKKIGTTTTISATDQMNRKNSAFLISNATSGGKHKKVARASFLIRDTEMLSKIAGLKKNTNIITIDNEQETITSVASLKKANKFVFTTLTAEEHELQTLKRKANEFQNNNEDETNSKKRLRTETRQQKCLIDQLL